MALQLKAVPAARGMRWIVDGARLFAKRPLGFTLLFVAALFVWAVVGRLLPFVGSLLQMMSLPLLSLGYMIAARARAGGPVHPGQFIETLRGDAQRRRRMLVLCALYGAAAFAIVFICSWISNDALSRLQGLMAQERPPQGEIDAILAEPGVATAGLLFALFGSLLAVPFWHAPALVHWGGQGALQSLFSSTLAVWKSRGAFAGYFVGWGLVIAVFGLVAGTVFAVLGISQMVGLAALPAGLAFSAVFYVSLLFTFDDSFGSIDG